MHNSFKCLKYWKPFNLVLLCDYFWSVGILSVSIWKLPVKNTPTGMAEWWGKLKLLKVNHKNMFFLSRNKNVPIYLPELFHNLYVFTSYTIWHLHHWKCCKMSYHFLFVSHLNSLAFIHNFKEFQGIVTFLSFKRVQFGLQKPKGKL